MATSNSYVLVIAILISVGGVCTTASVPPERPYLEYGGAPLALGARLTTREGISLSLRCVVNGGNPAPTIAWYVGDREVTNTSHVSAIIKVQSSGGRIFMFLL